MTFLNEAPLTHIQSVAFALGAQLAREHRVKVLLVGDAADTVPGGNWSRQWVLLRFRQLIAGLSPRLSRALADAFSGREGIPVRPFLNPEGMDVIDRYVRTGIRAACREAYGFVPDAVDRSILEAKLVHLVEDVSWYLRRGDRLGVAESIEYRVPFLDHRVVRIAINLPWSYQTRRGVEKWALKKVAARFLPRRIVYRKKVPWDLPLHTYLAPVASMELFARGVVCHDVLGLDRKAIAEIVEAPGRHLRSFYNLVNLELWGRLFLLGQTTEQVEECCAALQAAGARARGSGRTSRAS